LPQHQSRFKTTKRGLFSSKTNRNSISEKLKRGISVMDLTNGGTAHALSNLRRERELNASRRPHEHLANSIEPTNRLRPEPT
jgi:hypothetical protein